MQQKNWTRRQFLTRASISLGGWVTGVGLADSSASKSSPADPSKILNYHPDMEYRRLGKTELILSAVGLGGHSRSSPDERRQIIDRCIEHGINFIDCSWGNEVIRDGAALKGRRDKMFLLVSHGAKEVRNPEYQTAKKLLQALDEILLESGIEYADVWRITCFEPGGRHTFDTSCEIVEALTTAKRQGKARHIGFSSHDKRWIKFMIEYFPEIEVVLFPFTTMTKKAPTDSLFEALKKQDVGAIGIKPFAAGSLFTGNREEDMRRARLAIRYILYTQTVHPIPGMNSVEEVDNVALAVKERKQFDMSRFDELENINQYVQTNLNPRYNWLKEWEYV